MLQKVVSSKKLNPHNYYRLPWSLTDNGISWLEVTTKCNLACKGCYRDPNKEGHKTMEEIREELNIFQAKRKSDCMSIAGGDPLVHPQIVEIVAMVKEMGWKPILNTNGLALTLKLLKQLKKAGVYGFTFHIDTTQVRGDSKATFEKEHNQLRTQFAKMLADVGGLSCSFNQTVSERTLTQIPDTVNWAKENADIVHSIVFIIYREPSMASDMQFFAGGKEVPSAESYNNTDFCGGRILKTQDVVDQIRTIDPQYDPCGYLNGTVDPESFKWTLAIRATDKKKVHGYMGANFMQVVQSANHFFTGRWLSYCGPSMLKIGKTTMPLLAPLDRGARKSLFNFAKNTLKNPLALLKRVNLQTIAIIQAVDFMPDGQINMCDGCPDITVYNGELYWSCRLEEIKEHGCFYTAVPRAKLASKPAKKTSAKKIKERV